MKSGDLVTFIDLPRGSKIKESVLFKFIENEEKRNTCIEFMHTQIQAIPDEDFPKKKEITPRKIAELLEVSNPLFVFYDYQGTPCLHCRMSKKATFYNLLMNNAEVN